MAAPRPRRAARPQAGLDPAVQPGLSGKTLGLIAEAVERMRAAGDGEFTHACQTALERQLGAPRVLLTHSGTAALEMAALLTDIGWGDEVIMPSFALASTANAFVLRGARPVFVDVREDTLNLDETLVERAITRATRAIVPVHYAGVSAEMDTILEIARRHRLSVLEDATQGVASGYRGRKLGTLGRVGALGFHDAEAAGAGAGAGGALVINDPALVETAEQVWETGTDRSRLRRGEVDRFTWNTLGASFAPSEVTAALLWARLQTRAAASRHRLRHWRRYHVALAPLERAGLVRRPDIPVGCSHDGHLYRVLLPDRAARDGAIAALSARGVPPPPPHEPLHASPAGARFGRIAGSMRVTESVAERLIRLPLHDRLSEAEQTAVIDAVFAVSGKVRAAA